MAGRGRRERAAGQPVQSGVVRGQAWGGTVQWGLQGSGRRACRALREAWGTRMQGTARQFWGRKRAPGALAAGLHEESVPDAEPARVEVVGSAGQQGPRPLGKSPGAAAPEGEAAGGTAPGTAQQQGASGRLPESPGPHTHRPYALSQQP